MVSHMYLNVSINAKKKKLMHQKILVLFFIHDIKLILILKRILCFLTLNLYECTVYIILIPALDLDSILIYQYTLIYFGSNIEKSIMLSLIINNVT